MKTSFPRLIGMARRRAHRHHLAMVAAERRDDWRRADQHAATIASCDRLENNLVDLATL